jgi:hypothetical protein
MTSSNSGTHCVYDKGSVLDALATDTSVAPELREFDETPGIVIAATFPPVRLQPLRRYAASLRSSIWRQVGGRWQLVFRKAL